MSFSATGGCATLLKYANSFMIQLAQSSICNCFHTLQERLSRWLLVPATHPKTIG